jgi:hypothetical protein
LVYPSLHSYSYYKVIKISVYPNPELKTATTFIRIKAYPDVVGLLPRPRQGNISCPPNGFLLLDITLDTGLAILDTVLDTGLAMLDIILDTVLDINACLH